VKYFGSEAALAAARVGRESIDKLQLALDALLEIKTALADHSVRPFRGLREAYSLVARDPELEELPKGGFFRVAEASVVTSDFANLLLNSLTKRALQDYRELAWDKLDLLYSPVPVNDLKTQDRVREGYFGDLSTVAEDGPYTEIGHPTDEKVSYALAKYGNILTITEETIINDDLGRIAGFPRKIARAARRTFKQKITDFYVNNSVYDVDSVAWFNAAHGNLGAAALAVDSLTAARLALFKQTEKDSSKRLGLPLEWLMVPGDLEATALQLNQNDTGANPWYHKFGAANERIITNELLTDTNDWYCGSLPSTAPFLEMASLRGQEPGMPEIVLADDPRSGAGMFTNDRLVYRVKMRFGGDIVDFRPVYKAVVA
jgi:hypothetical protein